MIQSNVTIQELSFPTRARIARGRDYRQLLRMALLASDTLMVTLSFALAYWLRFYGGVTFQPSIPADPAKYATLVLILLPSFIVTFWLMNLYDFDSLLGGTGEYARTFNACSTGIMVAVLISFLLPDVQIARSWLVQSWIMTLLLVSIGRFCIRRLAYQLRHDGFFIVPAVIVGTNQEALALAQQLYDSQGSGLAILGYIAEESSSVQPAQSTIHGLPILGTLDTLTKTVRSHKVEEVIIATTALSRSQLLSVTEQITMLPGKRMRLSSGLYEILTTGMSITTKNSVPLMTLHRMRLDPLELFMKRVLDISLVVASALFLVPIFCVIGLLIHFDSPGPIFYRRRVLGVGGQTFDALKFRSMVTNGDEVLAQHPDLLAELRSEHKLKNDPRITAIGHFLRRTSLDELPQLINVLAGQMSLVGPRMITPEETEKYGAMKHNLLTVKPGLTGLWQVSGRSDLSYEERVQLDMHYIRNYSIWQDLQILFIQTVPTILRKRGAY